MNLVYRPYEKFIESRLNIINKEGKDVPFILNNPQKMFIDKATGKDIILKARQEGFSSEIGGIFVGDFILDPNSWSLVIADITDNAIGLLDRVKYYLRSYEEKTGYKIPLKYNSKYELVNEVLNSRYQIGTAENTEFGRSKTVKNIHMSEAFFYKNFRKLLASALGALRPDGRVVIESTANGFNEGKEFWDQSVLGETGFNPIFFAASLLYSKEYLEQKKKELGRLYKQEYPETAQDAFLTSGETYFNSEALQWYLRQAKGVISEGVIYG
ncbi:hypothetical protein A2403_02515 [Candidatus Roizmanbacteria bacterium RIFOXYC1_FULL_41_16]|nr:MAG: hypothetical protein A2612_01480 [Candidatus Moranbacteria bacterium RIFOXYD1_FULL_44_12]OGK67164.1 MAG: hypothetical protein A2377_00820 [Candidatus Roizmanbacteria bacterium RIFOXYB1_FULL_41_27]OGK71097.1 MAG: hypothetical protein A2403_02515 [Candidatus Roizmanbacteria bacterium RIFOXYC1_FULL_41_16]